MIAAAVLDLSNPRRGDRELMMANHGKSGFPNGSRGTTPEANMGPSPREEGLGRRRGSMLDALHVPRDARGIVLACGFVAVGALGISALLLDDPLGYGYLVAAAMGYFFLQTRLVPSALWLLISFGGAAGATAGNSSDWIVCGLGLLLAAVALLPVPADFREARDGPIPDSSGKVEISQMRTSTIAEDPGTNSEPPLSDVLLAIGRSNEPELLTENPGRPAQSPGVLIRAIGRLRIEINGRDLTQRLNEQPRLEFLFSYLLARTIRRAGPIDRPALADEAAPGISAGSQRDRLRKQLYALQSTLGADAKALLHVSNTHVSLDLSHADLDVVALDELSRLVGRRKSLIDAQLAEQITRALDETAAGELLAGFSELEQQVTAGHGTASQTVDEARALVVGWRADLVRALANYNEAAGHPQLSIAYLKSALTDCPQRQDLARLLVGAYLQTGQTARATEARLEFELTEER